MKVFIDCRPFVRNIAGTAMFLKLAIKAWHREYPEHDFILVAPQSFKPETGNLPGTILVRPLKIFGRCVPNFIWFIFYLPLLLKKERPDLFFTPSPSLPLWMPKRTKSLIIVHDVVNIEFRDTMEIKNKMQNWLFFERSIKNADYIWANSEYTCKKIDQYFPRRRARSVFSGLSVDDSVFFKKNIPEERQLDLREKYDLGKKFILFVGTIEPRKNLKFLLKLMPELVRKQNVKLLVVGARGWNESDIYEIVDNNAILKKNVVFSGFVPESDLVDLYNIANCFVSTSLNEGFGMPQLEAIMCRCPVVAAHNSAMIEVVAGRGVTIEGWQEYDWIKKICEVIDLGRDQFYTDKLNLEQYNWSFIIKGLVKYIGG